MFRDKHTSDIGNRSIPKANTSKNWVLPIISSFEIYLIILSSGIISGLIRQAAGENEGNQLNVMNENLEKLIKT